MSREQGIKSKIPQRYKIRSMFNKLNSVVAKEQNMLHARCEIVALFSPSLTSQCCLVHYIAFRYFKKQFIHLKFVTHRIHSIMLRALNVHSIAH